jgi:hypothetical protein
MPGDPVEVVCWNKVGDYVNVIFFTIGNRDNCASSYLLQVWDINDLTRGQILDTFVLKIKISIRLVSKDILVSFSVFVLFLLFFLALRPIIVVKYKAWKNLNRNTNKLQCNNPPVEQHSQG